MNVALKIILVASLGIASAFAATLPPIVTCQIKGTTKEFGARAKDCTPAGQDAACNQYADDPKLGPSKPLACKTFDTMEALQKAMEAASLSRMNPQPPVDTKAQQAPAAAPKKFPVAVTCTILNPTGAQKSFVTLANDCTPEKAQAACDIYKTVPFLGASKAAKECNNFASMDEIKNFLTATTKSGAFPGFGGGIVTCQTRGPEKLKFNNLVKKCDEASQNAACLTEQGIADSIACILYPTDRQIKEEIEKLPQIAGMECQNNVGGIRYRTITADCSEATKKFVCRPPAISFKGCALYTDQKALKKWSSENINNALVTCRLKDQPDVTYDRFTGDCSPATKKMACGATGNPEACTVIPTEKIAKEEIERLAHKLAQTR